MAGTCIMHRCRSRPPSDAWSAPTARRPSRYSVARSRTSRSRAEASKRIELFLLPVAFDEDGHIVSGVLAAAKPSHATRRLSRTVQRPSLVHRSQQGSRPKRQSPHSRALQAESPTCSSRERRSYEGGRIELPTDLRLVRSRTGRTRPNREVFWGLKKR